jgi:predicted nucleotidyltransferase component of viral defense system
MELNDIQHIKQLAIIALCSDDELMEMLVLKGGNAITLLYREHSRASIDIDFSIEEDFDKSDLPKIRKKIETQLTTTLGEHGYIPFDIKFTEKPEVKPYGTKEFWGGYSVTFKLATKQAYEEHKDNIQNLRVRSLGIGQSEKRTFNIDISKYEFCRNKVQEEIDGYTVYVYTPEMLVTEKIRAICQQMEEYELCTKSARARDFFDIHLLMEKYAIDLMDKDNLELIKSIFQAKEVPLSLIGKIPEYRDFHKRDFASVEDTVPSGVELMEYDDYFDYVVEKVMPLKVLWNI